MKPVRNVKYIVVHCTATPPNTTIESIQRYWKDVKGWKDVPGYHYIIKSNGEVVKLLDETKNSYGVYAHNSECISISYIGGVDKTGKPFDTRSRSQEVAMFNKIVELTERYPEAKVVGHRDFAGVKKPAHPLTSKHGWQTISPICSSDQHRFSTCRYPSP